MKDERITMQIKMVWTHVRMLWTREKEKKRKNYYFAYGQPSHLHNHKHNSSKYNFEAFVASSERDDIVT